jgi:uncharacterized protein (DUF2252 family)
MQHNTSVEAAPGGIAHPTPGTREARGKTARKQMPRSSHGKWAPGSTRRDPVELLEEQEWDRMQELIPTRHGRMLASAFAFYRGAAVIQAADLASGPSTGLLVQCCGDAHLSNFGGYHAPDRALVFGLNDFDETNHGPFEWDVKRLATSFELAGRATGIDPKKRRAIVRRTVRAYRDAMAEFATMRNIDIWYSRIDVPGIMERWRSRVTKKEFRRFEKNIAKAERKDSLKAFAKLTERVGDEYRIVHDPPLLVPIRELYAEVDPETTLEWLHERFRVYVDSLQHDRRRLVDGYRLVDAARKVVGVGSVGTRSWVLLLTGRDDDDPLFLQVKEATASVLEQHTGTSGFANSGQRVVEGQRLLQASSDILLGWFGTSDIDGVERDYYIRQLWDGKMSANYESMSEAQFKVLGQLCGWTLARGHARSGDPIAVASYMGSGRVFDDAIADYAAAYADQNQLDFKAAELAWG